MVTTVQQVIARSEALDVINEEMTIQEKFAAAFKVTHNHWMCPDTWQQFHAACEAVYLTVDEDDQERILKEVKMIMQLFGGYSVSIGELEVPEAHQVIGIFKIYKEVTNGDQ